MIWEAFLQREPRCFHPFEELLMQFCENLSQQIFAKADQKLHPELIALAFWLRKSHLEEMRERFQTLAEKNQLLVPRGLAFHIAPANVETLFVYSWILSLLVGNANVVRLPSRQSGATALLFSLLQSLMEQFAPIKESTLLLSYGHEEAITAAISAKADVRLIWGGDATIQTIRRIPLKVNGKELVFADRYAYGAIKADFYLSADEGKQQQLAELFYRDLFWYDQMTCASPRTLFWIGQNGNKASADFYRRLSLIAQARGYALPVAARLQKMTSIYSAALTLPITNVGGFDPLTVLYLNHFDPACKTFGGYGMLFHVELPEILAIADGVEQKDQTLVHAGFDQKELIHLAFRLNGSGLDRLVPIGQALQFEDVWDGYDLLAELTKRVVVQA